MATSTTYYIDTDSFSTATAVWINSGLTTKAPDGYYSFGGNYRQQFEGLLQSVTSCSINICKEFISFDYKTNDPLPVRYKLYGSNTWTYYTFTGLTFSGGDYITHTIDFEFPDGLCIQDGSWEYLGTEIGTPNMVNFVYGVSCSPIISYCYDGYWELNDPAHPGGGSVTYINNLGILTIVNEIWLGYPANFEASSIISATGCAPCV